MCKGRHLNLERAFSISDPVAWILLPVDIRHVPTLDTFKRTLKIYLFSYRRILIYDAQHPCEGIIDLTRHYINCPYHHHHHHLSNHNNRSAALYESLEADYSCHADGNHMH